MNDPLNGKAWAVLQGDCLDLMPSLPDGCVNAVITDPPYGLGDLWQGGGKKNNQASWTFDPKEAKAWDENTHPGVLMLPSLGVPTCIWGGNYYPLPPQRCWLIWDKKQNDNFTTGQAELAWCNVSRPIRVFRFAQCEFASEPGKKQHPTQKPLALMEWCIRMMRIPEGSLILDPYCGSGTTGVAAMRLGMRFLGIEISSAYCDIARARIAEAAAQPRLDFDAPEQAPAPKYEQGGLAL